MKYIYILFSKINLNLQQFQETPENKTLMIIFMIKEKKQAKVEEKYLMEKL